MRLTKIKLAGFKSFVDPTTVAFPSNLCCVVGPNGCGKSNTIDAVRWVMGESSAKHLRGESMTDVIFNGSSSRKPVGQASIELIFDNSEGRAGGQYAGFNEISVKRAVTRDGQSGYFLNNTKCRKRDITDLFLGTGLGPRSYAIIEQGMISRVIEAKPEELRVYVEEAAGISKYKERRRETENRIRHTKDNLDRLNDLREEIDKQLEKLQRQAKVAERYKTLKDQEQLTKGEWLVLRIEAMRADVDVAMANIRQKMNEAESEQANQRQSERQIEEKRQAHQTAVDTFNRDQASFYAAGAEVARIEQQIQHNRTLRAKAELDHQQAQRALSETQEHLKEDEIKLEDLNKELASRQPELENSKEEEGMAEARLAEYQEALERWQEEWETFNHNAKAPSEQAQVEKARIEQAEQHILQGQNRIERLRQEQATIEIEPLQEKRQQLEEDLLIAQEQQESQQEQQMQLAENRDQLKATIEDKRKQLSESQSQLQQAQGKLASLKTLQEAALNKASSKWVNQQGIEANGIATQLDIEAGWETAVETALAEGLNAYLVDDLEMLSKQLNSLEKENVVLLENSSKGSAASGLADKIKSPASAKALVAGVQTAETLEDALNKRQRLNAHESIITKDGLWVGPNWLRVKRETNPQAGVLVREKQINELEQQSETLLTTVEALKDSLNSESQQLTSAEVQLADLQRELNQAQQRIGQVNAEKSGLDSRIQHLTQRKDQLQLEQEELLQQLSETQETVVEARARLEEALMLMETHEEQRQAHTERRETMQAEVRDASEQARQSGQRHRDLYIKVQALKADIQATETSLQRMRQQNQQLSERMQELQENLETSAEPEEELKLTLEGVLEKRILVEEKLASSREAMTTIEGQMRELEQSRSGAEMRMASLRETLEGKRIKLQEIKVRLQTLEEQFAETELDFEGVKANIAEESTIDGLKAKLAQLAQQVSRLGTINLAAIEEYESESERKVYLDQQFQDLTEALDSLEEAIRKIDRETRTRFKDTFDQINLGVQKMFPRLFGGGHAYLELTGDDLLDTGVAIMARPPGKKVSNIHLLSGGEKALTAVALVFAIFELNPAPFCMLDEVDAPLDDANVGRFCNLVKEMSAQVQFIFITHNKIAMELATHLMGVTMQEPGVSRLVSVDVDEAAKMVGA